VPCDIQYEEISYENSMAILALRSDTSDAELHLLREDGSSAAKCRWQAGRELANQLPGAIEKFLAQHTVTWSDLTGVLVFRGPGSFTGLRIGVTVANTLAYAQNVPVIASNGDGWLDNGIRMLGETKPGKFALPEYGAEPHITESRK
jgi:tRNA threonylcarbamoyladenosine biosynthesis protein TsaB